MGGELDSYSVQFASVLDSSGTSTWTSGSSLSSRSYGQSCVTENSYIYCMGGEAPSAPTAIVQYASVPSGGGYPSGWTQGNPLNVAEEDQSCVAANNYLYCMGGIPGSSVVQYASIPSGGGAPSGWTSQSNQLAVGKYAPICVTANNYIYCMGGGGSSDSTVQYASIPSGGGATSAWQTTNSLAAGAYIGSCITTNNYIYCIGGNSNPSTVQYAQILSGGGTSTWATQTTNSLINGGVWNGACVTADNNIYCMGGYPSISTVQYASVP
jgi:hypothetical protein